jgi:hypothetical protein
MLPRREEKEKHKPTYSGSRLGFVCLGSTQNLNTLHVHTARFGLWRERAIRDDKTYSATQCFVKLPRPVRLDKVETGRGRSSRRLVSCKNILCRFLIGNMKNHHKFMSSDSS